MRCYEILGLLFGILIVFGILFMLRSHDQSLLQIEQEKTAQKDAWARL